MVEISRSAKRYQERRLPEGRSTLRGPGPQIRLSDSPISNYSLSPPLPAPELLRDELPELVVDTGLTTPWPHGEAEIL
jgi:hypothetical protein